MRLIAGWLFGFARRRTPRDADGNGNVTAGSYTHGFGGTIATGTLTGLYAIAANCTGTLTLNGGDGRDLFRSGPAIGGRVLFAQVLPAAGPKISSHNFDGIA